MPDYISPTLGLVFLGCGLLCFLVGYLLGYVFVARDVSHKVHKLYDLLASQKVRKCEAYEEILKREG